MYTSMEIFSTEVLSTFKIVDFISIISLKFDAGKGDNDWYILQNKYASFQ